ncbi:general stress protein [Isoptericola croceus]|uniref:general stress protein n=1 Tax=Isoptericola croceus TaxID=3031406 RepID=UPI0023F7D8F3|nr:general stress protein [Isoptericola croceus]
MSLNRQNVVPRVPTLPKGEEIAAYDSYLEAQKAVDYLSDEKFAVQHVTIVGTDLRMVERVTGRLTYGRVALAGALSGAWFGFFVGLLLTLFAGGATSVLIVALGLGAGFGLMFSVLSYAFTGGRRDFTSQSQIVASTYAILCATEQAGEARRMLAASPSGLGKQRTPQRPAASVAPSAPDPRWTMPDGAPRYGAMRPGGSEGSGGSSTSSVAGGEGPSHPQPPAGTELPQDSTRTDPQPPTPSTSAAPESTVDPDDPYAPPRNR